MKVNIVKKKTILAGSGITQTKLAKELGYSRDQIKHVLNLRRFTPHIQESIARRFGKNVEQIFGRWAWPRIFRTRKGGKKRGRRIRGKNGIFKG